mmetsp:Transcript_25465/g.19209  ORF Transcript_25465/g.19209 Transcript_25465/m.19209 type:complete len:107 (-) Transcript_25465:103-423(-)
MKCEEKSLDESEAPSLSVRIGLEDDLDEGRRPYYKLGVGGGEVDWTITLSRNDFPWHEVKFEQFSAKDCFDKFISTVKDAATFLKKVLGNKEKYRKMMQGQLNLQF